MREKVPRHVLTLDGSSTLYSAKYNQHYHSINGAVKESVHVFIEAGLAQFNTNHSHLSILEMGLGTGLNALLTRIFAQSPKVSYTALEAEPIEILEVEMLNYPAVIDHPKSSEWLVKIHQSPWGEPVELDDGFSLNKQHISLLDYQSEAQFDLVYFDAFAPDAQPDLWTEEVFGRIFTWCKPGAILTTYSAKGAVRRAMESVGFTVEKLPGPPGKREMIRAIVPKG